MPARIVLILFLAISCNLSVFAYSDADYISSVEQNLFNVKFANENLDLRLNRIEKNMFGFVNKGTSQQRLQKIKTSLGNAAPPAKATAAKKVVKPVKAASNTKAGQKLTLNKPKITKPSLPSINYPAVDMIENRVLNRTFVGEDITQRLSRLEIVVFKQQMQGSLDQRVDKLKSVVLADTISPANSANADYGSDSQFDTESVKSIVARLEQESFKVTYPNEPIESRLSRLEMKVFNQDSPEDLVNDRVERLSTVIAAQPSNELYRDMSQLRQYQQIGTGITAATMVLLLLKALVF